MGKAIGKIVGTSEVANQIMTRHSMTDNGLLVGFNKAMHPPVSPGPGLDALNSEAIRIFAISLATLNTCGPRQLPFFSWIRSEMNYGDDTCRRGYGPHDRFRNTSVEEAW